MYDDDNAVWVGTHPHDGGKVLVNSNEEREIT